MSGREPTFASFVLTFERPAHLRTTVEAMLAQTRPPDLLLVVDNAANEETASIVRDFRDDRLDYESTGANLGSAGGVAYGMQALFERGFDWIHSVDDDDPPRTPDTVERLRALIRRQDDGTLGAVAAVGSRWDWKRGEHARLPDGALRGDVDVDVIGGDSQLTVRRDVIDKIGTPEREFFFGHYDPLYCLRMQQAGFRLMVDGDLMREYRERANRLNLHERRAVLPRHGYERIWRRYYVTRNYIYAMRQTFDRPDLARREAAKAVLRSVLAWGRGPHYGARYSRLQVRGVIDGYRGRLGRTVAPGSAATEG